jgi:integrase
MAPARSAAATHRTRFVQQPRRCSPRRGFQFPIKRIQELLGHRDIRVTQAYIKLLRDTRKSASHEMPL